VFSRSSDSSFFFRGVQIHQLFSLHPSPVVNSQIVHHSCHMYFLLNIHGVNREREKMVPRNYPTFLLVRLCISNKNALVGYIPCYLLVEILIPILHILSLTSKLFSPGAVWFIHCSVYMNRGRRPCRHLQVAVCIRVALVVASTT